VSPFRPLGLPCARRSPAHVSGAGPGGWATRRRQGARFGPVILAESLSPGWLPAGLRVYAIGDAHGCAARLAALQAQIAADAAVRPVVQALVVYLGDYVDRGPDSAAVLDLLRAPCPVPGGRVVTLAGNHEQLMLAALDPGAEPEVVELWLDNGGGPTLESYGADPRDPRSWDAVPARDLDFLQGMPWQFALGGYVFVHAGVRPDVPLDRQDPMDLAWIREPFLSWRGRLPAVVVHGHTPSRLPEVLDHRIGIDTGAVFGGPLSCAVLEEDRVGFLFG
jgi:serine/threonine protein phosphatase 1